MKKLFFPIIFNFLIFSCGSDINDNSSKNNVRQYQNIVIVGDMSNRLDFYPPNKDSIFIRDKIKFFKDSCVQAGIKINDFSSIYFTTLNELEPLGVDLSEKTNLKEKQQFVNSTGKFNNSGLNQTLDNLFKEIMVKYVNVRNPGLDLLSLIDEKIGKNIPIKTSKSLPNSLNNSKEIFNYNNHIYLLTDGYLEYIGKNLNSQFYFSTKEIEKLRSYSNKLGKTPKETLKLNPELGLPPINNESFKLINLHVYETLSRDFNYETKVNIHPKGYEDNAILEVVWEKWAMDSGFKSFEWGKF